MNLLHGFEDPACYRGGIVSIGNFDGVHRGHQSMIATLVRYARAADVPAVVFTFDPHPITLLRPQESPPQLSTLHRKAELLEQHGVDCMIAYRTDKALLRLTPREFFERIIRDKLDAGGLVEGPNFCFGRDRAGSIETLRDLCQETELHLEIAPAVSVEHTVISSSVIRGLITEGDLRRAVEFLGHPYRLHGKVVRGAGRGRNIGRPTANLDGVNTLLPTDGVYAGLVSLDEHRYPAAVNLGPNPTFGEQHHKIEVHLVGFSGELYGRELDVDLVERVRPTVAFPDSDQLRRQLKQDVQRVRQIVEFNR